MISPLASARGLPCSKVRMVANSSRFSSIKSYNLSRNAPRSAGVWVFQAAMAGLLEATPRKPSEETAPYYRRLEAANAIRQSKALVQRSELLRSRLAAGKLKGTIRFYGTPAEEAVGGKVYMIRQGLFKEARRFFERALASRDIRNYPRIANMIRDMMLIAKLDFDKKELVVDGTPSAEKTELLFDVGTVLEFYSR